MQTRLGYGAFLAERERVRSAFSLWNWICKTSTKVMGFEKKNLDNAKRNID